MTLIGVTPLAKGTAARLLRDFPFSAHPVSTAGVVGTGGGGSPREEARRHPILVLRRHPRAGGSPGQRRGVPNRWGASSSTSSPTFCSPQVEVRQPAKPAPHLPLHLGSPPGVPGHPTCTHDATPPVQRTRTTCLATPKRARPLHPGTQCRWERSSVRPLLVATARARAPCTRGRGARL